jgi:cation diffusion facilitator family transporter
MPPQSHHHHTDPGDNAAGRRAALVGVVANIALAAAKLLGGLVGQSHALVADAIESLADLIGSVIIWGGLRLGAVPPDDDHPYGHGKAEAIAGLAVAGIIIVAGLTVLYESVSGLFTPRTAPHAWTLIVLVVVVLSKETLFRYVRAAARRTGSTAVEIDAWHHRVDAITSLTAGLGVAAAVYAGPSWAHADNWAAILGAGVILFNGIKLGSGPWHELMDRTPGGLPERIRASAAAVEHVRLIEKVHARKSGSRYFVDMHVHVDAEMSVAEAHKVSGIVKAKVRADVPSVANVLVHIEPFEPPPR